MKEVLKYAKYLTIQIRATDAAYDLCNIFLKDGEFTYTTDGLILLTIAKKLDDAIIEYTGTEQNG